MSTSDEVDTQATTGNKQPRQVHRRVHAEYKPGTFGHIDESDFIKLIDDLKGLFPDKQAVTETWVHQYPDTIALDRDEDTSPKSEQKHIYVDYMIHATSWDELNEKLRQLKRPSLIHHLTLTLADEARSIRIEVGHPNGVGKRLKSHKFLVTTDEPDDGILAAGIVKRLADKRGHVTNRAIRRTAIALIPPAMVASVASSYIDRAIRSGASGRELQDQIARPAIIGGLLILLLLAITYSSIRRMTACCIQANWPKKNPDTPATERLKQTLAHWWKTFDKVHPAIATLTAIIAVIIAFVVAITS